MKLDPKALEAAAKEIAEVCGEEWAEPPFNQLHTDAKNNGYRFEAKAALTAALSAPAAEPVAWQSRTYIHNKWTDWSVINKPLEKFKEYFQFNLDNGTVEIRPLYAAPLPAQGGKADE